MRKPTKKSLLEDEAALFRQAVRDATPLRSSRFSTCTMRSPRA